MVLPPALLSGTEALAREATAHSCTWEHAISFTSHLYATVCQQRRHSGDRGPDYPNGKQRDSWGILTGK